MRVPRSVLVLRGCCLLALLASAALTADSLHAGRQFCPLDAACAKARDSALGSFFGVKTSLLGIVAFAGLFLLTLLPAAFARKVARPAAWAAGLAGLGFVVYQGIVLGTFCPLCIVADLCGLGAAAAAFAWPSPLLYRGRKHKSPATGESVPARLRWALAAQGVVALPLLWPAPPAKPAWVELPAEAAASIDVAAEFAPFLAERTGPPADLRPTPSDDLRAPDDVPAPPPPTDVVGDAVPTPAPAPAPRPAPVRAAPPVAVIAPPRPTVREIVVLEYLNAFCSHCRATHARLDRVVAGFGRPVRRHRVYVWSSREVPLWAKACAVAAQQGREDAMFDALLETDRQDDRSIRAAAARAGVDLAGLDAPEVQHRLERDRRLFSQARLEGLPTFDVGRRRLMGEQSEGELLDALRAAAGG
jgi:uncharacterized membrane protein/protein-disulfide isomerase